MADSGQSQVNSLVSGLNASINNALAKLKEQQQAAAKQAANVTDYQKTVRKSSLNTAMFATDIGILAKETTRLTVVSNLAKTDTADFYKFKVTSKGEATMGLLGDQGIRAQLLTKTGIVVADSNKEAGDQYDAFKQLQAGNLSLDRGDYTLRITRDKDVEATEGKNYAVQLKMGGYTQDYDTIVKQPKPGDSPLQLSAAQQGSIDTLTAGLQSLQSISYGQTGTQKLMGSFSLFA